MICISRKTERGSALFFILIAVALFAALGYAVSTMMQGGSTTNIGDEKASLHAGEVLDYARTMRQTIQAMRIDGCRDTEISFENPIEAGYTNGTDTDCQVFHPDGGGLSYISPIGEILDSSFSAQTGYGEYFFSGTSRVSGVGSGTGGDADLDLVLFLPYLKEQVCNQINETLDTNTNTDEIPAENSDAWHSGFVKFAGTFGGITRQVDGELPVGLSGCREGNGTPASGSYFFYQVLIAR